MKIGRISEQNYISLIFYNKNIILTDIDSLFKETNKYFANILKSLYIDVTFDFSNKTNKLIYTHAFIHIICEYIKNSSSDFKHYFYSNNLTKDPFRLKLLKKLKSIFGFKIYEHVTDFTEIGDEIDKNNCKVVSELEVFFSKDHKVKSFKHIKKYLENTGLKELQVNYFEDIANKMRILS
jgi:hypothetical protein